MKRDIALGSKNKKKTNVRCKDQNNKKLLIKYCGTDKVFSNWIAVEPRFTS